MRRPYYVPETYRYVSKHGERRPRPRRLVIVLIIAAALMVAGAVLAVGHLGREAAAGWPANQPVNVHTIPYPAPSTVGR